MSAAHSAHAAWHEEQRSAYLYRVLAQRESNLVRQKLFDRLGQEALEQSAMWARDVPEAATWRFAPDARTRVVAALVHRFGIRAMRPALAAMKVRGMSVYASTGDGVHPMPQSVEEIGKRHKSVEGGNLRAAIFGVNDGLVSNASLIMGIAGANAEQHTLLLAGVAGLVAGAFSMAAGEYVSVRSQRELFEYQIGLERDELEKYPEEEAAELALIYAARGVPHAEAKRFSDSLIANPAHALDTLAREELGLNPDELGSPWGAAISSFTAFAVGALIPLLPFLLSQGKTALAISIGVSALTLLGVGAALSLFTGRGALRSGLRMLAIGAAAGAITYAVGKLVGVGLT
jgi:VIT1/CCC1 family predicted Fe2+/Mn2+ transporter